MAKNRLDPELLRKLALRLEKSQQYIREQISRRASKTGRCSEAELVLWCNSASIPATRYLNKQISRIRTEVQEGLTQNSIQNRRIPEARVAGNGNPPRTQRDKINAGQIVNVLLEDVTLKDRCRDIITRPRNHDRVIREATTILDDRLKTLSGIDNMRPQDLVGKVLSPDPAKAVIEVSSDREVQEGFFKMCSGTMLAYRNDAHHRLSNKWTQVDVLKFCGMIDLLLGVIGKGKKHSERV